MADMWILLTKQKGVCQIASSHNNSAFQSPLGSLHDSGQQSLVEVGLVHSQQTCTVLQTLHAVLTDLAATWGGGCQSFVHSKQKR